MNYLNLLINAIGSGLDIIIIYYYYDLVFEEPRFNVKNTKLIYFIFFVLIWFNIIIPFNSVVVSSISIIIISLISLLYKESKLKRFTNVLILITIIILSEAITGLVSALIANKNVEFLINDRFYYLQGVLIAKSISFILVKIIHKWKFPSKVSRTRALHLSFVLIPISTILYIYIISDYAMQLIESRPIILITLSALSLIFSNIIVFYIFERQLRQEKERRNSELLRQQLEYKVDYYKQLSDKHKASNKAVHDTKNQLYAVSTYLNKGQIQLAKEKVDELCLDVFSNIHFNQTGNDAIDALLNAKQSIIEELEIDFSNSIFIDECNKIDDIELCIIIGNLLDNAIEACLKISREDKRQININIKQVNDYLSMEISNTTSEKVQIINGNIITTKKDKMLHGFGLNSIKEIVRKNNGHISFEQINSYFYVNIYLENSIISPIMQI